MKPPPHPHTVSRNVTPPPCPRPRPRPCHCRSEQRERQRLEEEAARHKSEIVQLEDMFGTSLHAPGEQPVGVTMIDGYNLMHRVSG